MMHRVALIPDAGHKWSPTTGAAISSGWEPHVVRLMHHGRYRPHQTYPANFGELFEVVDLDPCLQVVVRRILVFFFAPAAFSLFTAELEME